MLHETITWQTGLPDSDTTVLVLCPKFSDPVWLGHHDGECWRFIDGCAVAYPVTHWAHLPEGPKPTSPTPRHSDTPAHSS